MLLDAVAPADATHTNGHADETTTRLQIINDEKHFNPNLGKQIEQWGLRGAGLDYHIAAVFGSQSTGKSTLLNALFGTDFDVMDESRRQQTTKGIWVCRGKDTNILVMDLEGTDGRERGEDKDFERKAAVFSLASSEILIINMWEYQIGWYNGANMSLLKTVFEVNLNLFRNTSARTLLLFVIRDHYGGTPLDNLRATLISDLSKIWDGLSKPPELENRLLSDYFDLEFTTLPHKILVPEKFNAEVQSLRTRFVDKDSPDCLFKDIYCKRVPADGVAFYMEGIWEQVQSAKDLDLPTQQELLAQYRCDEISAIVLAEFNGHVKTQKRPIEDGQVVEDLGDMMRNWKEQALFQYDCEGSRYHRGVYARKRDDLTAALISTLSLLFLGQINNLRRVCLVQLQEVLRVRLQGTNYEFAIVVAEERSKWEDDFKQGVEKILIEGADWAWENELNSLRTEFEGIIDQCKKDEREKVLNQVKKIVKEDISEPVKLHLDKGSNDMWDEILRVLKTTLETAKSTYLAKTKSFSTDEESESPLDRLRKDSWRALREKIDEETNDAVFSNKLRGHFEGQFRYDQQGVPRFWKPEDDIEEAFIEAKNQTLGLIPLYAQINPQDLPPELSFLTNTTSASEEEDGFDFRASLTVIPSARQTALNQNLSKIANTCYIEAKRGIDKSGWFSSLKYGLRDLNRKRVRLFNPLPYMLLPLDLVWSTITYLGPSRWTTIWWTSSVNGSNVSEEIELKEIGS